VLDLEEELAHLIAALHEHNVQYALCGGLALAVHGHPRATVDIDLLVREDDLADAKRVAALLGFTVAARPMTFHAGAVPIHRVTKIDVADGEILMLDLLLVTAQTEHAWSSRETHEWRGRPIAVVSRESLIALKRLRSSAQDAADIAVLMEATE
jgi:hypothetical protein